MLKNQFNGTRNKRNRALDHLSYAMQPFRRILQLCIAHPFDQLRSCNSRNYSLVPKERHVRKESNGSTLGLCVVPKESHDCTLEKELTPKESHD